MSISGTSDVVASWVVPMRNREYRIEFEHGTTTGKRVIRVDGVEILRREWMFKLVGREIFELDGMRCLITVEALGIFAYEYSLEVNGKTFQKFREQQNKRLMTWYADVEGKECRICLEKETMDVWVNGLKMETTGEFTDEGTVTHFTSGNTHCCFKAVNSGKRNVGIVHELYVNGRKVDLTKPQI
ncbi:hypothetical protein QR680_011723 [Steinernema hermaphroditum]|uniref:Fas apoptotic inhibitory molecule 1 n=1 Tax=Steinernema hermaphroditum TaxID=289476 RepID=A0AA39HZH5_9BILA|nr:hypothetical protein QR680_011723 [Steinernema hermaphroditum]